MPVKRFEQNPLLTPEDLEPTRPGLEIMCTLNPAAVRFGDEILLLVRVGERAPSDETHLACVLYDPVTDGLRVDHIPRDAPELDTTDPRKYFYKGEVLLTSMSHLRIARSRDGVNFTFDPAPAIFPSTPYEAYGCEDARITCIDGKYWITYTAVSDRGVTVALASTEDFREFTKHGIIFPPYQKDVCIFPEKVRGMYVCRHRPYMSEFNPACIWTAYSPDMLSWGRHEQTLAPTPRTWSAQRIGAGAPPIRTDAGWLEIIHGADDFGGYSLVPMLTELEHPERVISVGSEPVLRAEADYELSGVLHNVVFCNGIIVDDDGTMTIYYGAADEDCAAAVTTVDEMIDAARR
ncbi:MAG: glycoside hydrolase family 130 protein [Phycisphaerae bacterium]